MKESNPVEVAEYATAIGIQDEPALAWWVPFTLRKRDRIIASINSRVRKRDRKFGLRVPSSIQEAKEIDKENKNTLWMDALDKEMYEVGVAFKLLEDEEHIPVGYSKSSGHLI